MPPERPCVRTDTNPQDRATRARKQAIVKMFSFLKRTDHYDDLVVKRIALEGNLGYLIPVCELHSTDAELIAELARWREENAFAYPTQFPVTISGTTGWLRSKLLDVEDRILFLVLDRYGRPVGHLGLANAITDEGEVEIDNVVRGVKHAEPGIMGSAMQALLKWTRDIAAPNVISLRVLSDNRHAISFYHNLGFVDDRLIPLRRSQEGDRIEYVVLEGDAPAKPDAHFLQMVYAPTKEAMPPAEMILTAGPSMSAREATYALDAVRHGWNRKWSDYIERFEAAFAEYIGVKHALSTSSCTGALHLALLALGIGPDDEVIVPDITWVATGNAVAYVGATPVFADIERGSWCLDPDSFEAAITERTKAVIPVHLYGHPARMDRIMEIAARHGLHVVEDAAPAIGAEFQGRKTGTFGEFAAFSFQGAKLLVTGEGGMLVTNDDALYDRVHSIWDQGRTPGTFWINEMGWKYKMSNTQAAIGLGQLERVEELIEAKRRVFSWYAEDLEGMRGVSLSHEEPWARSIYWMASILLDEKAGITRDQLREALKNRKIDSRPVFPPVSQYPVWARMQPPQPNALRIGAQGINLPSGGCLTREQVSYIAESIKEVLKARR